VPDDGFRYELVDGEIRRMSPAGWRHGAICFALGARLLELVKPRKLGHVAGTDTGIRLPHGNVRALRVARQRDTDL
jgi:Uma2 family endonuclease